MRRKTFFLFTSPSNLAMGILMVFPLVMAIWLSFNFVTFLNINDPDFVGLKNYGYILSDSKFWEAFRYSLLIIVITVPTQIVLGFVMALLLDQVSRRVRGLFLALMLLPFIVVPVVGTLMFKQMFEIGGLYEYLYKVITGRPFLFNAKSVRTLIILHLIWHATPYPLVVFFAGLQTLPTEHLEAAEVDGAGRFQQIFRIVIPHLKPLLIMTSMILIMDMYRMFDSVFVISEQNPAYHAENLMMYNFRIGMGVQRLGRANTTAVLTVLGVLVVLIPFLRQTYRKQMGKD
jgi:ABC-type sugar transport system permease subunit